MCQVPDCVCKLVRSTELSNGRRLVGACRRWGQCCDVVCCTHVIAINSSRHVKHEVIDVDSNFWSALIIEKCVVYFSLFLSLCSLERKKRSDGDLSCRPAPIWLKNTCYFAICRYGNTQNNPVLCVLPITIILTMVF